MCKSVVNSLKFTMKIHRFVQVSCFEKCFLFLRKQVNADIYIRKILKWI